MTAATNSPSAATAEPIVDISRLRFAWSATAGAVLDLQQVQVHLGERVFVRGPSGSGKSTLLSLLAGVVTAGTGQVRVLGRDLATLGGAQRDRFRADHIGFIFQMFNLIPYLSVLENVTLACGFSARRRENAVRAGGMQEEARRLLGQLDMGAPDLIDRRITELSVGQQQRVAAARALIGAPELVIADEPTSALDHDRRTAFIDLLFHECERARAALVFVSHDAALSPLFDRVIDFDAVNRATAGRRG